MKIMQRTWAEIDGDALRSNIREIRRIAGGKEIFSVVKANAYGHGVFLTVPILAAEGITHFAASNTVEAAEVKFFAPDAEVLVFGYADKNFLHYLHELNLIQSCPSASFARTLSEYALFSGKNIRVHVKLDTGMSRAGISSEAELEGILRLPGLSVEGIYTHFSVADSDNPDDIIFTENQQESLTRLAGKFSLPYHSQNSGGLLYHRDFGGSFVRPGIIQYGLPPCGLEVPLKLTQALRFKSQVCQIKELPGGSFVGYGRSFETRGATVLAALLPVGYADGYSRGLSNVGGVEIGGLIRPVLGRVSMDQIVVDVSGGGVEIGDVADLYPSINEVAGQIGTIPYEVVCAVGQRVPRVLVNPTIIN